MNSVIQSLKSIPSLLKRIQKQGKANSKNDVLSVFSSLINSMESGERTEVHLRNLKALLGRSTCIFRDFAQKDAHEFMNSLINESHDLTDLFRINITSIVVTDTCRHSFENAATTTCLSLAVSSSDSQKKTNLKDLIQDFTQENDLNGVYWCELCNTDRQAKEQSIIKPPLPQVVIIHLRRFPYDHTDEKIDTYIDYEFEYRGFLLSGDYYKLCAVIMHQGSLSSGHYTAVTRLCNTEDWYYFSDSYVKPITLQNDRHKIKSKDAYVLIYYKENDWL